MTQEKKEMDIIEEKTTKEFSRRKFVTGAAMAGAAAAGGLLNAVPAIASTGSATLKINGEKVVTDVAPFIKDGRTVVPIRYVGTALQMDVNWDPATRVATVDSKEFAFPYTKKLDPEKARKAGFENYYAGKSCMYGAGYGLLQVLREEFGYPYTTMPADAFWYGLGGALEGSLCGAQNGALLVIGMILGKDCKAMMVELNKWYKETELPLDDKHTAWSKFTTQKTVNTTVNCSDSKGNWMTASGFESGSPERADRCAKLSGDVAAKAIELLNAHFGF